MQSPYWAIDVKRKGQHDGDTLVDAQAVLTGVSEQPALYVSGVKWQTLKPDLIQNGFKLFSANPDIDESDHDLSNDKDIQGWLVGTVNPAKLKAIGFAPNK